MIPDDLLQEYLDIVNGSVNREERQKAFEEYYAIKFEEIEAEINGENEAEYDAYNEACLNKYHNPFDDTYEQYLDIVHDPMRDDFSIRRRAFFERSIGKTLKEYEEENGLTQGENEEENVWEVMSHDRTMD